MRHRTSLLNTFLLLLLVSGWCSALIVVFCAHDDGSFGVAAHHECCRAKLEAAQSHCAADASSSHEEMAMDEMEAAPSITEQPADALLPGAVTEACLHCVSRDGLPTVVAAQEPEQKRRATIVIAPLSLTLPVLPFASCRPSQALNRGAPPGPATRRHLLLNVFVI